MLKLPPEILTAILDQLEVYELLPMALVNKKIGKLAIQLIWKELTHLQLYALEGPHLQHVRTLQLFVLKDLDTVLYKNITSLYLDAYYDEDGKVLSQLRNLRVFGYAVSSEGSVPDLRNLDKLERLRVYTAMNGYRVNYIPPKVRTLELKERYPITYEGVFTQVIRLVLDQIVYFDPIQIQDSFPNLTELYLYPSNSNPVYDLRLLCNLRILHLGIQWNVENRLPDSLEKLYIRYCQPYYVDEYLSLKVPYLFVIFQVDVKVSTHVDYLLPLFERENIAIGLEDMNLGCFFLISNNLPYDFSVYISLGYDFKCTSRTIYKKGNISASFHMVLNGLPIKEALLTLYNLLLPLAAIWIPLKPSIEFLETIDDY